MSFNDLARKEAADEKASQEKEMKSTPNTDEGAVPESKPGNPPPD